MKFAIKFLHQYTKNLLQFIKQSLILENKNLRFWYIITFAIGILTCFFIEKHQIIILLSTSIFILFVILLYCLFEWNKNIVKVILKFLIMFGIGYTTAYIKYIQTENNNFYSPEYNITIEGQIKSIKLTSKETIFITKIIKSPDTTLLNQNVRIKVDEELLKNKEVNVNNVVSIKTSLIPIKYSNFPNDKSYENYAKFFDIIATGKAKSFEVITNRNTNQNSFFDIQKRRNNIQKRIYDVNNYSAGAGIIISVLTGNNSFIPKEQLNNIRHSGCAHILAISGLHMSIIVTFVFFISIHFFALFPQIALRYNTKKLALLPAILTCFFYINIANVPISALRSFLMVIIASITLLTNRTKSSLNALFITFFAMLLFSPNYILSPSFQMSFMAVFGLTTLYNSNLITESALFSCKKTIFNYTTGIFLSSIIATISTVFFEIYHFKQYAWIGLISNIPVIPLTEFFVLPFGFIGMIFNGNIIGDFFYLVAGFFANIVCIITDCTANLPKSFLLAKQMINSQLSIIIFGIICLFLSYSKIIKFIGLILLFTGFILYLITPKYLLVYNKNFNNIVFFENDKYYSYYPIKSEYIKSVWSQNLGVNEIFPMTNENKNLQCKGNKKEKNMHCKYNYNGKTYNFYQEKSSKTVGVKFKNDKFITII